MRTSVIWHDREIEPFESLYCILHKLCRWNRISGWDILPLVATVYPGSDAPQRGAHPCNLCPDPQWLDTAKLLANVPLSQKRLVDSLLSRFQYGSENALGGLRYCRSCLAGGYHSALYQQGFIRKCPIHGEALLSACPSCLRRIAYALPMARDPFSCPCGWSGWMNSAMQALAPSGELAVADAAQIIDALGRRGPKEISQATAYDIVRGYDRAKRLIRNSIHRQGLRHSESRRKIVFRIWRRYWEENRYSGAQTDSSVVWRIRQFMDPTGSRQFVVRLTMAACFATFFEWSSARPQTLSRAEKHADNVRIEGRWIPHCVRGLNGVPWGAEAIAADDYTIDQELISELLHVPGSSS